MHAEDDRYAKFFLFTDEEVRLLCKTHENHRVRNRECENILSRF